MEATVSFQFRVLSIQASARALPLPGVLFHVAQTFLSFRCQPRAPVTVRPEVGPVSYRARALSQRLSLLQPTSRCRKCVSVVFLLEFPAPPALWECLFLP